MAHVDIDLPNKPKGAKVIVPGLGAFKNGEVTEVNDKRWNRFVATRPHLREEGALVLRGRTAAASAPSAPDEPEVGATPSHLPTGAQSASEPPNEQALSYGSDNESSDEVLDANDESKEE